MLDKAKLIVEAGTNVQKQFAQTVLSGLTVEEKQMCIRIFDKICNNAEEYFMSSGNCAAFSLAANGIIILLTTDICI